ncbi:hypothetical protein AB0C15_01190 [Micromonospora sp. NPDC048835]|uniref:hypothetical protein n=1 Tax=Micromonospora sp. NPDC048835 TaxID=3155147 RepID=UPI0033D8961C
MTSIDISDHLVGWANRLHHQRGVTTITCHVADGMAGYPPHAPYQRLVAWCTPPRLPRAWVEQLTFGRYAQSTAVPVDDALTIPSRWVDCVEQQPDPAWTAIGWRDRDNHHHRGAQTALNLLLNPAHIETTPGAPDVRYGR